MPGMNQKGPKGAGPLTGGGQGVCRRTNDEPRQGQGQGREQGQGRGLGRGQGQGLCRKGSGRGNSLPTGNKAPGTTAE